MRIGTQLFGMMLLGAALVVGAPSDGAAQQVYDAAQLSEKPRIASPMAAQRQIQSSYPTLLQREGVQGKVVLQFVVTADGKVDASTIAVQVADDARLEEAAKKAIAQIEFVPGTMNGSAVATRVSFPISYVTQ